MAERSFGRALGTLALALLNASLLLAALCLWLAWGALSSAERVSLQIRQAADTVTPLRADIAGLTREIGAARADLAALNSRGTGDASGIRALEERLTGLEAELRGLTNAVTALGADPEALIDRAVMATFASMGAVAAQGLANLRLGRDAAAKP